MKLSIYPFLLLPVLALAPATADAHKSAGDSPALSRHAAVPSDTVKAAAPGDSIPLPPENFYVPGDLKLGFYAGVGGLFRTGGIAPGFSNTWAFNVGLLVSYCRVNVEGMFLYGTPTINNPNITDISSSDGIPYHANVDNANLFGAGFSVGYEALDTRRFSISPWVGGFWTSYNWSARPMSLSPGGILAQMGDQSDLSVSDFNVGFGVNLEWHFARNESDTELLGSDGQEYISTLRLMPYFIRGVYGGTNPSLNGWQIGIAVAYSGVARLLNLY